MYHEISKKLNEILRIIRAKDYTLYGECVELASKIFDALEAKEKTARWQPDRVSGYIFRCSGCRETVYDVHGIERGYCNYNYCPNCGATMLAGGSRNE